MVLLYARGSSTTDISDDLARNALADVSFFQHRPHDTRRKKVCIVPPDYTRVHSRAGMLTRLTWEHYGNAVTDVMPALGTHAPVSDEQRVKMFGDVPSELFRIHDWRNDVVTIAGEISAEQVRAASNGALDRPWPAQLNKLVWNGGHDLILSIGQARKGSFCPDIFLAFFTSSQVVPHEVMGMSNHSKNLFVGVGGKDAIDFSHFIGAAYGMERMMGRADNPLRRILTAAADRFLGGFGSDGGRGLPVVYILTVVGPAADGEGGAPRKLRGLFVGDDIECFDLAARLSKEVNFTLLDRAPRKVVVYLDPEEFHSTWLGNKAIYRTRMAIADGGELIIMAPGVSQFGEDARIDMLIRRFGYRTTPEIMAFLAGSLELRENLSAAAHLIHGSTEGRFRVTYCPGPALSRADVEGVGYAWGDAAAALARYPPERMRDGWNRVPVTAGALAAVLASSAAGTTAAAAGTAGLATAGVASATASAAAPGTAGEGSSSSEESSKGEDSEETEEVFYVSNPALGLWALRDRVLGEDNDGGGGTGTCAT
ncbi:unnamed protein product [Phaeothamnion confervicola]